MRLKDTIKGAKKILSRAKKNPNLYSEAELAYVKMLKRQAKKQLDKKKCINTETVTNCHT